MEVSSILASQGVYSTQEVAPTNILNKPNKTHILPYQKELNYSTPLPQAPQQEVQRHTVLPPRPPGSHPGSSAPGAGRAGGAGVRECHVCGERAGKHSYYGGQVNTLNP